MLTQELVDEHAKACTETLQKNATCGPWFDEPHRIEFSSHGFDCLMVRNVTMGHWCGYVGVPNTHPYFGQHYDKCDVDVHGGLTYCDSCQDIVCHLADIDSEPLWWLGFDCAHFMDLIPAMHFMTDPHCRRRDMLPPTYKDVVFVQTEIKALAEQLKKIGERR